MIHPCDVRNCRDVPPILVVRSASAPIRILRTRLRLAQKVHPNRTAVASCAFCPRPPFLRVGEDLYFSFRSESPLPLLRSRRPDGGEKSPRMDGCALAGPSWL